VISGSNTDLGSKTAAFSHTYTVTDAQSASVSVTERLIVGSTTRTLRTYSAAKGATNTFALAANWSYCQLGQNKLEITADDGMGGVAIRVVTFTRVNSLPVISGSNTDLGSKTAAFNHTYTVTDTESASVSVTERLIVGGTTHNLRTYSAAKGATNTFALSANWGYCQLGQNKLEITATDSNGGVAIRSVTFTRVNSLPVISGSNEDLGVITEPFEHMYTVSDVENNSAISVTERLVSGGSTRILRTYTAVGDVSNTAAIADNWIYALHGANTLEITATDSNGGSSTRTIAFTRSFTELSGSRAVSTDAPVTQCLVALYPLVQPSSAELTVEASNNPFDAVPVWEDVTNKLGKYVHTFANKTIANGPGFAVRFRMTPDVPGSKVYIDNLVCKIK
jgi:hypothetical protein